jgi:hypothetical protein
MWMYAMAQNEEYIPSKSTVPDPSVSISAMIPSKSSDCSLSSRAFKISLNVPVVMYPFPTSIPTRT